MTQPVGVTELASSAKIKVTAKCGEKKQLSIEGVSVEFSCEGHPEVIPSPHSQDPGRVALVVQDFASLLERLPSESEIDTQAPPVVFTVPHDRSVSLDDLSGHISVAHQEHRAIRLDIGSQRQ